MVLSNKKLKEKLRSKLAESVITSMSKAQTDINVSTKKDSISKPQTLKQLMNSETPKPRLTKREKRRKSLPLISSDVVIDNKGIKDDKIEIRVHEENGEKKKRKREGDVIVENGGEMSGEGVEAVMHTNAKKKKKMKGDGNGDVVVEKGAVTSTENGETGKKKSNAKRKKKKKKKSKKKGKIEEEKKTDEVGNGEQGVVEAMQVDESALINQGSQDVASKVYVGGIPYYSTEDDIRSYFESCGTITHIDCMTFPETGKFRGIAMLTFKTEAAAKRALAFDGADMGGLFLKVQPYKATRDNNNRSSDFSPKIVEGYNRIYIGNLSWDITEEDVKKFFSDCKISTIRFGKDKETGEFKGYAHVDFSDSLFLTMALKLDQQILCGRPVKISCAVPKKPGENKKDININKQEEVNKAAADMATGNADVAMGDADVEVTAGSGKIKRRTCYECGEKGHLSSACPNMKKKDEESKKEDPIKEEEKENKMEIVIEASVGKIKRRTCYECGEKGHLSSACPNMKNKDENIIKMEENNMEIESKKADDDVAMTVSSGKIKRRTCYECGQKGHLSSACPSKQ